MRNEYCVAIEYNGSAAAGGHEDIGRRFRWEVRREALVWEGRLRWRRSGFPT
jgi:hypothetical protein